jgi:hypothetical protein
MLVRRLSLVAGATAATVLLSSGAALAHGCYFTNPNPNADAGRAGSSGFVSVREMAHMFLDPALCEDGVQVLATAAGVTPDTMINAHGMMAGPTGGNKAIRHMDFAALDAAIPGAFAACGTELPPRQ